MLNKEYPSFCETSKKTKTCLFILLFLVLAFGLVIYLAVGKCAQNCSSHGNFGHSCIEEGSLYCCPSPASPYGHTGCEDVGICELDNQQCGSFMLTSEVLGGVLALGLAYLIIQALCRPQKREKPQLPQTGPLTAHLINKFDEPETTVSERSSTDRWEVYPDRKIDS